MSIFTKAPKTVTLLVCAKCGRTDRYANLRQHGKHYFNGRHCDGVPAPVVYERAIA